jgi:hypothetical protein
MYYFNWKELARDAEQDFAGILTLAYAITFGYNNKIAWTLEGLYETLHIIKVPHCIVRKGYIVSNWYHNICTFYKVREPQSYFKNDTFLTSNASLADRVKYLYILSKRPISNKTNSIPVNYIDNPSLLTNPFLQVKDDKIFFPLETIRVPFNKYYKRT